MPIQKSTDAALASGRRAYERHAWGEAYESLSAADAAGALGAEDLERLGDHRVLLGRPDEFIGGSRREPISRPSGGRRRAGDPRRVRARG